MSGSYVFNTSRSGGLGTNTSSNFMSSSRDSYGTTGLRQRHPFNASNDENSNPNSINRTNVGKLGVRAPPRERLTVGGGRSLVNRNATAHQLTANEATASPVTNENSLVALNDQRNDSSKSLWVVAYGYRTKNDFRALYDAMSQCGKITAWHGGLSVMGENRDGNGHNNNWVALKYDSQILAHKALTLNGTALYVGSSSIMIGVIPLARAEEQLDINVDNASAPLENFSRSRGSATESRVLNAEEDVLMLDKDMQGATGHNDVDRSPLDSFCGKLLAWIFDWDV